MPRQQRTKRAPNREPTSLAITSASEGAIDPPITPADLSNVDPDLLNHDQPPQSPISNSEYPPFDYDPFPNNILSPEPDPIRSEPRPFVDWLFAMEVTLFSTLCEEVGIGKRADSGFKKEAWIAACDAIADSSGYTVTVDQCKSKADSQKALWRQFNWLKDQSGFGYDEETGLITAGEQAWADVIKVSNSNQTI
jgi:hypothetical protein